MMTRDEILALAGLMARATKGPWRTAKKDPCRVLDSAGTVRVCHAFSSVMRDEIDDANADLADQAHAMAETLITMQAELDAERAAREKLEAEGCCLGLTPEECAQVPGRHCQGIGTQDD